MSSGLLFILNGNVLLPIPRLTINVVFFISYKPLSYLGKNPWCGAITPPIKGSLICPPCACPLNTKSNSNSEYISISSGLWDNKIV